MENNRPKIDPKLVIRTEPIRIKQGVELSGFSYLIIIIALLFLFACGSRTSKVEKQSEKLEAKTEQNLSAETESETKSETTVDYSKFWENQNIEIGKDGNPFTINYRGFEYSGSAPITITNTKEKLIYKTVTKIHTTFKSVINYKTETTYKSQITSKNKYTERKPAPFWLGLLIGAVGTIIGYLLWKLYKPKTF